MQAKPILLLHTLIGGFIGITMLLIPGIMTEFMGLTTDVNGLSLAQHDASWVLTTAILAF